MTRREMIKTGIGATALSILGGIPLQAKGKKEKHKILVIGAHPDDPETGAGGTICLLTKAGHEVVCVYLTRGQGSARFDSPETAAAIRVKEAQDACAVMGARPVFMDQVDAATEVNAARYAEMRELIEREAPDVVLTHWPIDAHRDHAACALLVRDAWKKLEHRFKLYYYEVMTGGETELFNPTDWVDISSVREQKYKACYCHKSQDPDWMMNDFHATMETFRGFECGCTAAEAFIRNTVPGELV